MGKGYRLGRYRAIKPYSNGCDIPVTALAYPPADSHNPLNVRFGSKADIHRHSHLRPLSGAKRTLDVCFLSPKRGPASGNFDRRREGHLNLD